MSLPNVYNMPSGADFLPSLARGLRDIYGERLNDALILLPTRRAVRALGEAFVGERGASLLPRMRPLADINPEEPPFEPGELVGLVKPAIDPMQRRFEIASLVAHYHRAISDLPLDPAGALALADPLIAILDDAAMEEAGDLNITQLLEDKKFAAEHFQNAVDLYRIIQEYWPLRLKELDLMEPMARRVSLLKALTEIWEKEPPEYPVIIAGSTGTLKASADLMRCVSRLNDGMIVLPGLENLKTISWNKIDLQHPQNALKTLIKTIGIEREDVKTWPSVTCFDVLQSRRLIISEALVPVQDTGDWPARITAIRQAAKTGSQPFVEALSGLSVIEAANDEEEALTIALIMREVLETPSKTAALVTPDPALARRVKARLRRWNVNVDYSQGEPLEETPLGAWLSGVMLLVQDPLSPVALAGLLKHKLTALGQSEGEIEHQWKQAEPKLRGVRNASKILAQDCVVALHQHTSTLTDLDMAAADIWARHFTEAAEAIATTDTQSGAERLWVEDAGEKAASLLEGLIAQGHHLPEMDAKDFAKLLGNLMRGRVVRPRYGMHPRLSILGPLEARMLAADRIILGGLNEGIWPSVPSLEPFLSRGMRETLKLSLPERRFGLSAHDFAELAANPDVILTRSARSDDGPKVASRWLWRLQTLLKGALQDKADTALSDQNHYLEWARQLDAVAAEDVEANTPPKPTPPLSARWPQGRQLSVTRVKTWIRDPYSIYAYYILGLRPFEDLDMELGAREFGNAIHNGLEVFVKQCKTHLPPNAESLLVKAFETALIEEGFEDFDISKDKARLEKSAAELIERMRERRSIGWAVRAIERKADYILQDCDFALTAKADLVEKGPDGYAVTDYKTGNPASVTEVQAGFDPQLPLTAFLLEEGGFENLPPGPTAELNYVRVKGFGDNTPERALVGTGQSPMSAEDYAAQAIDDLRKLIADFDKPATPYYCQPRAKYTHDYSDYNHLARKDEWARLGEGDDG